MFFDRIQACPTNPHWPDAGDTASDEKRTWSGSVDTGHTSAYIRENGAGNIWPASAITTADIHALGEPNIRSNSIGPHGLGDNVISKKCALATENGTDEPERCGTAKIEPNDGYRRSGIIAKSEG
jgi:hypothetical protein